MQRSRKSEEGGERARARKLLMCVCVVRGDLGITALKGKALLLKLELVAHIVLPCRFELHLQTRGVLHTLLQRLDCELLGLVFAVCV